ncbi:MAG: T9SS type A sorting domain-containing protein, partial [Bacteroidales bacterium]|nr:T9SS type A sorting domain-containing protein [Bacteroidales bacterium]
DASLHGSTWSITNQLGRTVLISKLSNETSIIDISKLSAGIYIFKLGGLTYKLLKK